MIKVLRWFLIGSFCALHIACSMTPEVIQGPDGTPHQLITCYDVRQCYTTAAKACNGKYKIANTTSRVDGTAMGPSTTIQMLVKCEAQ